MPHDLRVALRALTRRPGLSTAVIVPIAFALAINVAVFSVTDGLLFRPLPFQPPDQLVTFEFARLNGRLPEVAYRPERASERAGLLAEVDATPLLSHISRVGSLAASFPEAHEAGIVVTGIGAAFFRMLRLELAASGLLGAMFYCGRSRSREMAIRIALGAQPDSIRQAVVLRGTAIVAGGIVIGTGGGIAAGRVVASQLFGVDAVDLSSLVTVSAFMLGLAWVAALIPARASEVDPAVLLRQTREPSKSEFQM